MGRASDLLASLQLPYQLHGIKNAHCRELPSKREAFHPPCVHQIQKVSIARHNQFGLGGDCEIDVMGIVRITIIDEHRGYVGNDAGDLEKVVDERLGALDCHAEASGGRLTRRFAYFSKSLVAQE
jgi:hypothetical protein